MRKLLIQLGFSDKEADVYLALLELGTQAASVIAKKTGYPKSTVLFLFQGLVKRGYIKRSQKGRVQYFFADPNLLQSAKEAELLAQKNALDEAVPLLQEFQSPYSSEPKLTFYEGIDGCRNAYNLLLESETEILEFGAHADLESKMGRDFMDHFISERTKKGIFLKAVAQEEAIERELQKMDGEQMRKIQLFPAEKGKLYSSIAIFEEKVLLLSLFQDAFAILIENKEVADTLKTIFHIIWKEEK